MSSSGSRTSRTPAPYKRGGELPQSTPEPLEALVSSLLADVPRDRPTTARRMLDVLHELDGLDDIEDISGLVLLNEATGDLVPSRPPPLPVAWGSFIR